RTARRAPTTAPGILVVPTLVGTLGADQGRHLPEGATCADQGAWDPGRCQPWLAPWAPTKVGIYRTARRAPTKVGIYRTARRAPTRAPGILVGANLGWHTARRPGTASTGAQAAPWGPTDTSAPAPHPRSGAQHR